MVPDHPRRLGEGFTALGEVIGPSVPKHEVAATLERILEVYRGVRHEEERFVDTVRRVGLKPFKERVCAILRQRELHVDHWRHLGEGRPGMR